MDCPNHLSTQSFLMAKLKLLAQIQVRKTSYKNILVFLSKAGLLVFYYFFDVFKEVIFEAAVKKWNKKKDLDFCQCYKRYFPTRGHTPGKAAHSFQICTNSRTDRLSSACTCFAFWLPVTLPAYMMRNRAQARKYFKEVMLNPIFITVLLAILSSGSTTNLFKFLLKAISWAFQYCFRQAQDGKEAACNYHGSYTFGAKWCLVGIWVRFIKGY